MTSICIDQCVKPFKGQVWAELRHNYNSYNLFEDPEFPATDKSMFFSQRIPIGAEWRRPKDVMSDPQFIVDKFDRADLDQGYLGNCWFIAGCVGIMQSEQMFAKVVPTNQGFDNNYGGIFHFRFWQYGQWYDVVIDDRLPFYTNGKLVFCSNKQQPNEMWAALLEKAYAKLYGSYECLDGGFTTDALIDMSGGIEEGFDLTKFDSKQRRDLWPTLLQAYNKGSIIGCSINADPSIREARQSNGLVKGHAYTVTKVTQIKVNGYDVELLRCRNPWGNEVEWNGLWSDNSSKWNAVSDDQKHELGFERGGDGEFWMEFDDFVRNWHSVSFCHLSVDCFSDELVKKDDEEGFSWRNLNTQSELKWICTTYHGSWETGHTAGGCGQPNQAKYWTNPQFHIKLTDVDKDDNEHMATIIVALMQKDSRIKRIQNYGESAEEFIQFRLFKIKDGIHIEENTSSGLKLYSNQLDRIGTSGSYINMREITKRFRVEPGDYLIIPSTYDADRNCEFMLRLFTESVVEYNNLAVDKNEEDLTVEDTFFEHNDLDTIFSEWSNLIGEKGQEYFNQAAEHIDNRFGGRVSSFTKYAGSTIQRVGDLNDRYGHHLGGLGKRVDNFAKKTDVKENCNLM